MNDSLTQWRRIGTSLALIASGLAQAAVETPDVTSFGSGAGIGNPGMANAFFGTFAGAAISTGYANVFAGYEAGSGILSGDHNAFFGFKAGTANSGGANNAFFGSAAGFHNTFGFRNAFFGDNAGNSNVGVFGDIAGSNNTAVGYFADFGAGDLVNATAIGAKARVDQSNSLVLGSVDGVNQATSNVNVGIGTTTPARQLHLKGDNAVFRMDRSQDAAAFILVRTDAGGMPLKTFVVGANALGSNNGTFVINDLGTAVGGGGHNRMTIYNDGSVHFPGIVTTGSSIRFKHDVSTLSGADVALNQLRGVRFTRSDNGKPDIGLIAEEVAQVYPELVGHHPETGAVEAVNYQAFVGVLIEGFKAQQATITAQQNELNQVRADYQSKLDSQQQELSQVRAENQTQQAKLESQQQELSQVRTENQVQQAKLETQQQELAQLRADQNQQLAALREQLALLEVRLALSQGTAPSVAKR